jgi:excisionase family DNA binding protein
MDSDDGKAVWLTVKDTCAHLGCSASTLRKWAEAGALHPTRTPGGHRRFLLTEVEALLTKETK